MFEEEKEAALTRIASYGVADIMQERDFAVNLKAREDLYETLGPISCFCGSGRKHHHHRPGRGQDEGWCDGSLYGYQCAQ